MAIHSFKSESHVFFLPKAREKKHADLVAYLDRWSVSICNIVNGKNISLPSYDNAVIGSDNLQWNGYIPNSFAAPPQVPQVSINGSNLAPSAVFKGAGVRSRSNSNKRRRGDDGNPIIVNDEQQQPKDNPKKKGIVGTSNSRETGRKMKSPPADIFVWGVHRDTTVEDIVLKHNLASLQNSL